MFNARIRSRSAMLFFLLLTSVYVFTAFKLDDSLALDMLGHLSLENIITIIFIFSLSLLIRYARWVILMRHHQVKQSLFSGLLFYISGFAYSATPGKVGELSRVIHYNEIGIPSYVVVSCFIIERLFDLVAVLILSIIIFANIDGLEFVAALVILMISVVIFFLFNKNIIKALCKLMFRFKLKKTLRVMLLFYLAINSVRNNLSYKRGVVVFVLALMAWSMVSLVFVYTCWLFHLDIEVFNLYSIYPVAMLSGAVSFIPGGVGATEGVMILLLNQFGTPVVVATMIAIIVRISTLWLAILLGFICTVRLSVSSNYKLHK